MKTNPTKENTMPTTTSFTAEMITPNNQMRLVNEYKQKDVNPSHPGTPVLYEVGCVFVTMRHETTDPFDARFLVSREYVWNCTRSEFDRRFQVLNQLNDFQARVIPNP